MRSFLKVLVIMIVIASMALNYRIFASDTSIQSIFSQADNWITEGRADAQQGYTMDTKVLRTASNNIYNILLIIAIVVATIVGAILAIQFMTAGIDKKVQVKEGLVAYAISCVIVFGSFGIWKLCVSILGKI